MTAIEEFYRDKVILVTGGAGSIGSEIVRTLVGLNPRSVRVLDINETALFDLEQELDSGLIRTFVGDVRDKYRLKRAIEGVDIVFHAAALKHVPLCEYNPFEAVKTNIMGTQNLIDAAMDEGVDRFVTISTDKAVNPINVMGATKLLSERLTTSANLYKGYRKTAFSVVRFGNVLNSRGSILPLLSEQIRRRGVVTLTDPEMTRFIMSINEAVRLVLKAATLAKGGEIFILKMPAVKIKDLIEVVVEELSPSLGVDPQSVRIEVSGKRPGEKLYEELMTKEESVNSREAEDMFVVEPEAHMRALITAGTEASTAKGEDAVVAGAYSSDSVELLGREEIKSVLRRIGYLE